MLRAIANYLGSKSITRNVHKRLLSCEVLEPRRMLATLTVNTLSDNPISDDGQFSLREAITVISQDYNPTNTNGDKDQISGNVGQNDIIQFASNVTGAIDLALGEMMIKKSVVIQGPGRNVLTIDAGGNSRIFNIDDNNPDFLADITISGTMPGVSVACAGYCLAA